MEAEQKGPRGFRVVEEGAEQRGTRPAGPSPELGFGAFVLSLASSALVHLGGVSSREPSEGDPAGEPNLPLARQTIDVLEMLEVKTRGNLDAEEQTLLAHVLHDLRMRYVEQTSGRSRR